MNSNNSTPSAQRIMRPLPMTEKNTVERAIEIEKRMEFISNRVMALWEYLHLYGMMPTDSTWAENEIEELEAELSDLQREYRE